MEDLITYAWFCEIFNKDFESGALDVDRRLLTHLQVVGKAGQCIRYQSSIFDINSNMPEECITSSTSSQVSFHQQDQTLQPVSMDKRGFIPPWPSKKHFGGVARVEARAFCTSNPYRPNLCFFVAQLYSVLGLDRRCCQASLAEVAEGSRRWL